MVQHYFQTRDHGLFSSYKPLLVIQEQNLAADCSLLGVKPTMIPGLDIMLSQGLWFFSSQWKLMEGRQSKMGVVFLYTVSHALRLILDDLVI